MTNLTRASVLAVCAIALAGCAGSGVISQIDGPGVAEQAEFALELTPDTDVILEGCLTQVVAGARFLERAKMGPQGPFVDLAVARTIRRAADIEICLALVRGPVARFLGGF